jgi:hypothetical protein
MATESDEREPSVITSEMKISVTGLDEARRLIGDEETVLLVRERSIRQGSLETHREIDPDGHEVIHITKMPERRRP